jgi:NH3-dependent NAD+ synthetase
VLFSPSYHELAPATLADWILADRLPVRFQTAAPQGFVGRRARQMSAGDRRAVVLLSGGLDSATVLAMARSQKFQCYALSVHYGQRHSAELDAAKRVAARARRA